MKALNYSDAYLKSIGRENIASEEKVRKHRGEWITYEIALKYFHFAQLHDEDAGQDIGTHRLLRIELEDKYGLTEIEAVNIINGNHIREYVNKYELLQHRQDKESSCDEYLEKQNE